MNRRESLAVEFVSMLNTLEICYEIHRVGKVNTAIRSCAKRLTYRVKDYPELVKILTGVQRQTLPLGELQRLRRVLVNAAGGNVSFE